MLVVLSFGVGAFANSVLASEEASHGDAHGAEAGHGGDHHAQGLNWFDFTNKEAPPLVALIANFLILFAILYKILSKSLSARFQGRKEDFETALKEAQEMKARAEKAYKEARAKMDAIDLEMARLREEILGAGKAQSARILEDAEAQSTRIRSDSKAMVDQEIAMLSQDIRKRVVEEIVSMAEQLVREKIEKSDLDRLTSEYVEGMGPSSYLPPPTDYVE